MPHSTPASLTGTPKINWVVPAEISSEVLNDEIFVYRSSSEDTGYEHLDTLPAQPVTPGVFITRYEDASTESKSFFYLVTFNNTTADSESAFNLTFKDPTPRQLRLINGVKACLPAILQNQITNDEILAGLKIAIQIFNTYPPETGFNLDNFPRSHEYFLLSLAAMNSLACKYLVLSIKDFRYSEPGGVTLDIDRGAKINQAIEIYNRVYAQFLPMVKLDFAADFPLGQGTIQLPLSLGGVVSRGILNVLDIFTAVGR